jgi:uncharacterized membrane protein
MSELVVVSYPDVYRAGEVCAALQLMKDLAGKLQPIASILFVLFRKVTWEKVLPHISQYGGTVMHSSLTREAEAQLQSALTEGAEPKAA